MYKNETTAENRTIRKRKRKKTHLKDGGYAAISPISYKVGQLVNIGTVNTNGNGSGLTSGSNLVFKYIHKEESQEDPASLMQGKSIFLDNYGYYLGDIPLNGEAPFLVDSPLIKIEEINLANLPLEHLMKIREMSMVFTELTFKQIFALDKFIRENMSQKKFSAMRLTVESQ